MSARYYRTTKSALYKYTYLYLSNTTAVGAGTPQGTVSGPNDFKLVINDLTFNTCYAKYVDDTTVLSVSKVRLHSKLLQIISSVGLTINGMMISTHKTKELIILFVLTRKSTLRIFLHYA